MAASDRVTVDLFCAVVDNFGDIGVAWRLARCLCEAHGWQVRLWVDHLEPFQRLEPAIDVHQAQQFVRGIEVRRWNGPMPPVAPARVVIEAFGCPLPPAYLEAMARATPSPVWINLEYLSAEAWIETVHGHASPHARLPLVKWFFFPGFTDQTGGLLREQGLAARRRAYLGDRAAQARDWQALGVAPPEPGERRASLFCYPNPRLPEVVATLGDGLGTPWTLLVPEGVVLGEPLQGRPGLTVVRIPFVEQDRYDRLLWVCDLNFVRGEDSFIRAQWARRPFIWQAYPQDGATHLAKVAAFAARFEAALDEPLRAPMREVMTVWNGGGASFGVLAGALGELWARRDLWQEGCVRWADRLEEADDLATRLVNWVAQLLK